MFWWVMELCSTERGIVKLFECLELKKMQNCKEIRMFSRPHSLRYYLMVNPEIKNLPSTKTGSALLLDTLLQFVSVAWNLRLT